jgi:hypothetical protein
MPRFPDLGVITLSRTATPLSTQASRPPTVARAVASVLPADSNPFVAGVTTKLIDATSAELRGGTPILFSSSRSPLFSDGV